MNTLLSGYNRDTVIRSHEERLAAMRASRTIPDVNRAAQESGRLGSDARMDNEFRAAIIKRDESRLVQLDGETLAQVEKMRRILGGNRTQHRLSISQTTLERVLEGRRVSKDIASRIRDGISKPYEVPAKSHDVAPESLVAAVRTVLQEEGSYRSTASRLGVGFSQVIACLEGRLMSAGVIARMTERAVAKPADWVRGPMRALQSRIAEKELRAAQRRARMAKMASGNTLAARDCARVLADLRDFVSRSKSVESAACELGMNTKYLKRILSGSQAPGKSVAGRLERVSHAMQVAS